MNIEENFFCPNSVTPGDHIVISNEFSFVHSSINSAGRLGGKDGTSDLGLSLKGVQLPLIPNIPWN